MRTDFCGELNESFLEKEVVLYGWVNRRRDHGGVIFLDLRDKIGLAQIVINPETKETFKLAESIRNEFVLKVKGRVIDDTIEDVDLTTAVIRTQNIFDRLPKEREKVIIKAPSYYMNNRKKFIQNMTEVFSQLVYAPGVGTEYFTGKEEIEQSQGKEPTASKDDFKLLMHQKIVRDYLNLYTPYRGLLLYHGLGSGKTCSSIAVAEGLKNNKHIIVMLPASLETNYLSELKHCADPIWKINQHWSFLSSKKPLIVYSLLKPSHCVARSYTSLPKPLAPMIIRFFIKQVLSYKLPKNNQLQNLRVQYFLYL